MIAYLRSDAAPKPDTVAEPPAAADPETVGRVTADIVRGDLFLRRAGDRPADLRLRFEPSRGAERAVPAGRYLLLGYRHVAEDADGVTWIWSTTSAGYRELVVEAGEAVHVDVRRELGVRTRAFHAGGQQRLELAFHAEDKLGHTLYRDSARIGIRWQCLGEGDSVLSEGPMAYG